jgi:hypothetical protein
MSESSKAASSKAFIALIAAALIAAGAFFGISYWEKDQVRKIEENLKLLSGSAASIEVSFWNKSAVINGLKLNLTMPGVGVTASTPMTMTIEKLTIAGANTQALRADAVVPLADSLRMDNAILDLTQENLPAQQAELKQEIRFASATLTGLRGNLFAAAAAVQGANLQKISSDPQAFAAFISIVTSFHADSISASGYTTQAEMLLPGALPMTVASSTESLQAEDFSLLSCGAAAWKNMRVSINKQNILGIGSMAMQRMSVPDIFTPMAGIMTSGGQPNVQPDADEAKAFLTAMLAELKKAPLLMQGFSASDISLDYLGPNAVTVKKFSMDLELDAERLVLKNSLDGLSLPAELARSIGGPMLPLFPSSYNKALNFSGRLNLLGKLQDSHIDLHVNEAELAEQELGSAALDAELEIGNAAGELAVSKPAGEATISTPDAQDTLFKILQADPDLLLKKARITLIDKKALELASEAQYEMYKQVAQQLSATGPSFKNTSEIRSFIAQKILQDAEGSPDNLKNLLQGLAKLTQHPGALVINFTSEKPLPLNDFDSMNVTVTYTPDNSPQALPPQAQ